MIDHHQAASLLSPSTQPRGRHGNQDGTITKNSPAFFERTRKGRKGYPSETHVKLGLRIVHGDKWLEAKLGRNDPCPGAPPAVFKNCCLDPGYYEGADAIVFFRE